MMASGNGQPSSPGTFFEEVIAKTPGGEALRLCLQCGTCGGSCPSGEDMDYTPRHIFAMLAANMKDKVLRSNTPWYCVSCYYCTERCPQEIPITDIMYTLKRMAIAQGLYEDADAPDWSQTFIGMVEQFGRSYELGLATRYHLTHRPLGKIRLGTFALDMLRRDRLALTPSSIRNTSQLRAILDKAKELEGAQ
ncbi:MAG: 4Fe-4S dicluster domain-containing protein [Anaerolineales bacterium]|nr:MAG: 4Fe-4S dicluster domain-containing protein [Anaerolineales bacterium]